MCPFFNHVISEYWVKSCYLTIFIHNSISPHVCLWAKSSRMPLLIVNCIFVWEYWIELPPESNYSHNEAPNRVTIELLLIARRLFMSPSVRLTHTNGCVSGTLRNWIFIGCSYGHAPFWPRHSLSHFPFSGGKEMQRKFYGPP